MLGGQVIPVPPTSSASGTEHQVLTGKSFTVITRFDEATRTHLLEGHLVPEHRNLPTSQQAGSLRRMLPGFQTMFRLA